MASVVDGALARILFSAMTGDQQAAVEGAAALSAAAEEAWLTIQAQMEEAWSIQAQTERPALSASMEVEVEQTDDSATEEEEEVEAEVEVATDNELEAEMEVAAAPTDALDAGKRGGCSKCRGGGKIKRCPRSCYVHGPRKFARVLG